MDPEVPILLLHGALGSRAQLAALRQRIGGHAIDLTGHGGRALPNAGLQFEHFVADIEQAYAELDWQCADIFGYSMGGYAALLFAARHPGRVRTITTLGTKYLWTPEGLQKELRLLDPETMLSKVPAFAQRLSDIHGDNKWRALVAAIASAMGELAAAPLLTEEVKARITCPVMLCVGEGDTTAIPEDTRVFALGLPNARVEVLPGAKHPFESVDLDVLVDLLKGSWSNPRSKAGEAGVTQRGVRKPGPC